MAKTKQLIPEARTSISKEEMLSYFAEKKNTFIFYIRPDMAGFEGSINETYRHAETLMLSGYKVVVCLDDTNGNKEPFAAYPRSASIPHILMSEAGNSRFTPADVLVVPDYFLAMGKQTLAMGLKKVMLIQSLDMFLTCYQPTVSPSDDLRFGSYIFTSDDVMRRVKDSAFLHSELYPVSFHKVTPRIPSPGRPSYLRRPVVKVLSKSKVRVDEIGYTFLKRYPSKSWLVFEHMPTGISHEEYMKELGSAMVLLYLDDNHANPLPIVEALACGTPVVAQPSRYRNLVQDDATGAAYEVIYSGTFIGPRGEDGSFDDIPRYLLEVLTLVMGDVTGGAPLVSLPEDCPMGYLPGADPDVLAVYERILDERMEELGLKETK